MNNNTHDRKIQVKNHKRFQCVYTQVIAQYGFAANYVLDYLFRQGKPLRISSKRFSQVFRYACEDTYLDVVSKLQEDGLLYRVVECKWDRGLKQPRVRALYGLTEKGRDFIAGEKQARRWVNVAFSDLIVFNGRINHAYHYTLLRASTPTEFQLTLKELSAIIDASTKTTRNFMAYLIKHHFLIVKEESRRGVTGVYCHAFAPIPSVPNQEQYTIHLSPRDNYTEISCLELNGENTPKTQERKPKEWKFKESISKAEILQLFDPTDEELVPLSKMLSMTYRETQKGYVYWSKSLWHNVIYRFAKECVSQGFSLYHFLDACVRVMYRDKSAAQTVDMFKVFKVLETEKLLGWAIPHTLEHGFELVRGQEGYKSRDEKELACMWDAAQVLDKHHVQGEDIRFCLRSPYFLDRKVEQFLQMMLTRDDSHYENWLFQHRNKEALIYMDSIKSSAKTVLYSDLCVKYGKNVARRLAFSYEFKSIIRFGKDVMADVVSVVRGLAEHDEDIRAVEEDTNKDWKQRFAEEVARRDRNQPVVVPSASAAPMAHKEQLVAPWVEKRKPAEKERWEPVKSRHVSAPKPVEEGVLVAIVEAAFEGETEAQRLSRQEHVRGLQDRIQYCAAGGAPVVSHKRALEAAEAGPSPDAILQEQLEQLGVGKISLQKRVKGY